MKEDKLKFSHTCSSPIEGGYVVLKDNFKHLSEGSVISKTMLNCYLTIIPSAAKVVIEEMEEVV